MFVMVTLLTTLVPWLPLGVRIPWCTRIVEMIVAGVEVIRKVCHVCYPLATISSYNRVGVSVNNVPPLILASLDACPGFFGRIERALQIIPPTDWIIDISKKNQIAFHGSDSFVR
jgi:hypothetical protein